MALTDAITKYDFIVGYKDVKEKLEEILPEGASIVYCQYIEDPTVVYAVKKFDTMDYFEKSLKEPKTYQELWYFPQS